MQKISLFIFSILIFIGCHDYSAAGNDASASVEADTLLPEVDQLQPDNEIISQVDEPGSEGDALADEILADDLPLNDISPDNDIVPEQDDIDDYFIEADNTPDTEKDSELPDDDASPIDITKLPQVEVVVFCNQTLRRVPLSAKRNSDNALDYVYSGALDDLPALKHSTIQEFTDQFPEIYNRLSAGDFFIRTYQNNIVVKRMKIYEYVSKSPLDPKFPENDIAVQYFVKTKHTDFSMALPHQIQRRINGVWTTEEQGIISVNGFCQPQSTIYEEWIGDSLQESKELTSLDDAKSSCRQFLDSLPNNSPDALTARCAYNNKVLGFEMFRDGERVMYDLALSRSEAAVICDDAVKNNSSAMIECLYDEEIFGFEITKNSKRAAYYPIEPEDMVLECDNYIALNKQTPDDYFSCMKHGEKIGLDIYSKEHYQIDYLTTELASKEEKQAKCNQYQHDRWPGWIVRCYDRGKYFAPML